MLLWPSWTTYLRLSRLVFVQICGWGLRPRLKPAGLREASYIRLLIDVIAYYWSRDCRWLHAMSSMRHDVSLLAVFCHDSDHRQLRFVHLQPCPAVGRDRSEAGYPGIPQRSNLYR